MQMLTDNPEITIINDVHDVSRTSVINALNWLQELDYHRGHVFVLSDLENQGNYQRAYQSEILVLAVKALGEENVYLIGPEFLALAAGGLEKGMLSVKGDIFHRIEDPDGMIDLEKVNAYANIEEMIEDFDYENFRNKTVLLKGAQRHQLERLIPYLSLRATATHFKINLDHLCHNLTQFRSLLHPETRLMVMVKALGYGSGDWEVAQALEKEGIDYFAVAYTSTGITLRTHGVTTPIMVMNADPRSISQLFRFDLEPVVYGFTFLNRYLEMGRDEEELPLHVEADTGMSRLGFQLDEVSLLSDLLSSNPQVQVKSVMSHLSMADIADGDAYTHTQAKKFKVFADALSAVVARQPLRHLVNTAGILRFPEYHSDMVRLGLGLYGCSMVDKTEIDLREVGSLHSVVTQVHDFPAGQAIGYGGSEVTESESRVATVAIGYADGIRRSLSNGKMSFLVKGKRAPVIGRICMDMLMLNVTGIAGVEVGDEVVLIGAQGKDFISVQEIADASNTIPYEVLVNIGQRVQRIYVRE